MNHEYLVVNLLQKQYSKENTFLLNCFIVYDSWRKQKMLKKKKMEKLEKNFNVEKV